jgi:hypothetical protein
MFHALIEICLITHVMKIAQKIGDFIAIYGPINRDLIDDCFENRE